MARELKSGDRVRLLESYGFDSKNSPRWNGCSGQVKGTCDNRRDSRRIYVNWDNGGRNYYDPYNLILDTSKVKFKIIAREKPVDDTINISDITNDHYCILIANDGAMHHIVYHTDTSLYWMRLDLKGKNVPDSGISVKGCVDRAIKSNRGDIYAFNTRVEMYDWASNYITEFLKEHKPKPKEKCR